MTGTTSDPDGTITNIQWIQTSGITVTLNNENSNSANFIAPTITQTETLSFRLSATNAENKTFTDSVQINITPVNSPPQVNAGDDQTVNEQVFVNLAGATSDPDGTIANIQWIQTSGIAVTLNNANSNSANFIAPTITQAETLSFRLSATDAENKTSTDSVQINITPVNQPPTIEFSNPLSFEENTQIILDTVVNDEDGVITSYQWEQILGLPARELTPDENSLHFISPNINNPTEKLTFKLSVVDNEAASASAEININITNRSVGDGPDTDNDGYSDSWEKLFQFSPHDPNSKPFDQTKTHAELLKLEQSYLGTEEWQIEGLASMASAPTKVKMLAFVNKPWFNLDDTINVYISSTYGTSDVEIFRFGYYGGKLASLKYRNSLTVSPQIKCVRPFSNSYYNRCDWSKSLEIKIPEHWLSGMYMLKVTNRETNYKSWQTFIVQGASPERDKLQWEHSDILLISGSLTEAGAYNMGVNDASIGSSFYRAYDHNGISKTPEFTGQVNHTLGFFRPQTKDSLKYVLLSHLPVIANLEKNNFDVSYISDWEQDKQLIRNIFDFNYSTIVDVGHSEYHTDQMRESISVLSEKQGKKWLSIAAANTRFEQILKGDDCGTQYNEYSDDFIYCRPTSTKRTWYGNDLNLPETEFFGSRYVGGASGALKPIKIDPTSQLIKGDSNFFYSETNTSKADYPILINNYGFIETDTRTSDSRHGHVMPFENHVQDFLIIGDGRYPDSELYTIDPTYILLSNCSQLLHGASLGSGFGLLPIEASESFIVKNLKYGEPNLAYTNMVNNFLSFDDDHDGKIDHDTDNDGIINCKL